MQLSPHIGGESVMEEFGTAVFIVNKCDGYGRAAMLFYVM